MPSGAAGDIGLIGRYPRLIHGKRVQIATHAEIDVKGHVHEMAGAGHEIRETHGMGFRPFRPVRGLDHVNVVVDRPRMVRMFVQYPFEDGEDLRRSAFRPAAVRCPVVPRREIHQGLGVEDLDVRVLGVAGRHSIHGRGVGGIESRPLGVFGIALAQRLDQ